MDSVAKEHNAVHNEDWPKDIDLKGFEAGAYNSHKKYECDSFPHVDFAHGSNQGFVRVGDHFVKDEGLLIFREVLIKVFVNKVFGGEVTDDELEDVKEDEVSYNIV